MPRATIKDVAERAGLSVATVNRVLHDPDKVRRETRESVLAAAEALGFYATGSIRHGLLTTRPRVRIGILLLQRHRVLYRSLAQALEAAARAVRSHEVVLRIHHLDELSPAHVAQQLDALAETASLIGVVAAEHPTVAAAIEALAERSIRVFALISQLTARCGVGYVGLDAWKVGRTAGWLFHHLCRAPGPIGILVGNHRYRCQETNESGFRSYFREHGRGFDLLEARATFETASIAQDVTERLLEQNPTLAGLYVSGGGISGVVAALRASGRARDIVTLGYDLTDVTRAALLDGTINVLISHPLERLARETIAAMLRASDGGPDYPPEQLSLPFDIVTPENL